MPSPTILRQILPLIILSGCAGDRPPLAEVRGTVTAAGKAVTAGTLILHPEPANSYQKDKPSSLLQTDGSFQIQTFPFGPGAPPGRYKATLSPELAGRLKKPAYGDASKTPWTVAVPAAGLAQLRLESGR